MRATCASDRILVDVKFSTDHNIMVSNEGTVL